MGEAISDQKAQHSSAIAGSTTIVFVGFDGLITQIPKLAGGGTQADTRSNGDGVVLGDDYWNLNGVHALKLKGGTIKTAAWPAGKKEIVLGRHESDAFVGTYDGTTTFTIYKVPLADAGTPTVFATTPMTTFPSHASMQGNNVWFETSTAKGAVARFDTTATAPATVATFTPPDNRRLWTAAGENVIFQNGFVTSSACTYNELHGPDGKLQDLPSPAGFCQFFQTFRDPGFVYRVDALQADTSYTKVDTATFAEVGHVCGGATFIDTELATEDEKFVYINNRHSGLAGDPLKRYPKF